MVVKVCTRFPVHIEREVCPILLSLTWRNFDFDLISSSGWVKAKCLIHRLAVAQPREKLIRVGRPIGPNQFRSGMRKPVKKGEEIRGKDLDACLKIHTWRWPSCNVQGAWFLVTSTNRNINRRVNTCAYARFDGIVGPNAS